MKKWLRRILIGFATIGLAYGALYEYATHVGRGWLRGEAFFEGRPTSYWRSATNDWVDRFDTPQDAEMAMQGGCLLCEANLKLVKFNGNLICAFAPGPTPRPTFSTKVRSWIGLIMEVPDDSGPPAVFGDDTDAEPVLRELEDDPAMQPFVARSRARQASRVRELRAFYLDDLVSWQIMAK